MSLWKRIFRRNQTPPSAPPTSDEPKLNEDWAPGDQALCLQDFPLPYQPKKDEVYIVQYIVLGVDVQGAPCWGLSLRNVPNPLFCMGYKAEFFRKIVPRKDEETTDIGVSELIKQCNPAPVKAG